MGIVTLIEKILHLILWGFRKPLHRARFARLDELTSITSGNPDPTSLLIGVNRFRQFLLVRPTKTRRELGNMLICAPTRAGKGLLATSQLLSWKHSVVVNDIKGEIFSATAGYRATLGDVFVIDPTGEGHRYDPLRGKETEFEIYALAAHLLFKADEGEGAIFTQRATDMLTQIFLAAKYEGYPAFAYARTLIRSGLTNAAKRLHQVHPALATQFLDIPFTEANFTDRFLLSAWGTLKARIKPLLTETVVRSLIHSDFTTEHLLCGKKPVSVYIRWSERHLLALSPLVRLLWGSFINEFISLYDKTEGKGCQPVLLLIDEAGRTAIPSLADHATTVVGRGITLWVAIQSIDQMRAEYGAARAEVMLDNMETQLYYRPSGQKTADYLEHCLGKKSGYASSQTLRDGSEKAQGKSEEGIPLKTAQEIKQMKDEQIIGFHRMLPPFRAQRVDWRQHPLLMKRKQIPAPLLSPLPPLPDIPDSLSEQRFDTNGYIDPDLMLTKQSKHETIRRALF